MKRAGIFLRLVAVGCAMLVFGPMAQAQVAVNVTGSDPSLLRGSWQQRAIGRSTSFSQPQGDVWAPVGTVSTVFDSEPAIDSGVSVLSSPEFFADEVSSNPGPTLGSGSCATCDGGHEGGLACSSCGDFSGPCDTGCGPAGCRTRPWIHHFALFAGVQGFKGPLDGGIHGNFGFNEGLQWSAPLTQYGCVGYQIGARAAQSNFEGDRILGQRTDGRDQQFLTAGLFMRPACDGWQWGVVYDFLHDKNAYGSINLGQLRGEVSWLYGNRCEVGFWGAFSVTEDEVDNEIDEVPWRFTSTDMYTFFYRQQLACGGSSRLWGGFTGEGDGLVGADLNVPMGTCWALDVNFNYLMPNEGANFGGQAEESWGMALGLVWHFGGIPCVQNSPYQPLLSVADNSVFMADFH